MGRVHGAYQNLKIFMSKQAGRFQEPAGGICAIIV